MASDKNDDKKVVVGESTHVVHVRADSDSELQALFDCVLKPSKTMPLQKPFKMRNLPPSFFNPPSHRQSPAPTHSREGSADSTYGGGAMRAGGAMSPAAAIIQQSSAPQHFRHHSSPASLQQTFAVAAQQSPVVHAKQHSYDALAEELGPLPQGWEQAVTSQGQIYFLNHVTQTTTWVDPRRKNQQNSTSSTNSPQQLLVPGGVSSGSNNNNQQQSVVVASTQQGLPPPISSVNSRLAAAAAPSSVVTSVGAGGVPTVVSQAQSPAAVNSPLTNGGLPPPSSSSSSSTPAPGTIVPTPEQLASIPLPEGWEQSVTPDGEVYFINHIDKITSWHDPRIARLQSQILKTQLVQQSPLGSPNSQVSQQMVGGARSPSHLGRLPLDNNRLKSTPNTSPDTRKKTHGLRRYEDVIWANTGGGSPLNQATLNAASLLNNNNTNNNTGGNAAAVAAGNPTALLQLHQQIAIAAASVNQQQQQLNNNNQQQQQLRQGSGGDPFLCTLASTPSDLHTRQESADSGLGLGGLNGGTNGSTSGSSSSFTAHPPTTPEDFLAAMEDVEITPSENRRSRNVDVAPSPAPSMMEATDLESMDSEDLVPSINMNCDLTSDFLSEVIGTNRMDNTWL